MKDLINLKEKHYLVGHNGKTYAVNGNKYPWEQLNQGKQLELHPISKVGIINYNEAVKVSSIDVIAEGHYIPTPST